MMIYSSAKLLFVVEEQTGQTLGSKVTVLLDHSCLNSLNDLLRLKGLLKSETSLSEYVLNKSKDRNPTPPMKRR